MKAQKIASDTVAVTITHDELTKKRVKDIARAAFSACGEAPPWDVAVTAYIKEDKVLIFAERKRHVFDVRKFRLPS